MASRTLHVDVSDIPAIVELAAAGTTEAFVPKPAEPPSAELNADAGPGTGPNPGTGTARRPLSEYEQAVLTFEKQHWKYTGIKEQAIRDRFEWSPTRYYQVLNALLDRPEAQEFEPALVKRLRRLRDARQRARSGRVRPNPA
ncbi:MAG TPA: DUF3263 domain-containing protein [Actinocrinis sp.]|nr:DUF3263 domain-containing protein [Actinocrinis sp.]HEV2343072.1 DUF3263 domain-containing protein [Actinocrinis sp.]